ncbi:MAG TPA: hypothetical protein VE593_12030 [Nitrososphaeraceae archaeon]|nr:hypothetical protein [Nitrososphaeraceae archaeon]
MRYYIKCKINPEAKGRLADSINSGSLARGAVFYEAMQTALREGSIDDNDVVHFVEVCYCLEGGLYPMAMEIPILNKYFDQVIEVKDARLRDQCTMECEFCDCTRNIKLPGKSLSNELNINKIKEEQQLEGNSDNNNNDDDNDFLDIGRIQLNRKKQKEGLVGLKSVSTSNDGNCGNNSKIKPIFAGAAISGLFAVFHDGDNYFRIKNIPDNKESRQILYDLGLEQINGDVQSMKMTAMDSLAKSDKRSNVV